MHSRALSRQIQALEKDVLVQLLLRNRRRVQIIPAGQVFLERARLILARADEAVLAAQRAGGGVSGTLNLGFVGSATYDVLPAVLRELLQAAPHVDLTLSEMTVHAQLEALTEKRIDIGLLRLPAETEGLVFRRIAREPLYVALPSSHRLAQLPALRLAALSGPFVLYPDHPRPSWTEFVIGLCQQAGFRPVVIQRTVEIQTTLSLVAAGIGVSIVPKCIGNLQRKNVVFRRLVGVRAHTELLVAYREGDSSPVVQLPESPVAQSACAKGRGRNQQRETIPFGIGSPCNKGLARGTICKRNFYCRNFAGALVASARPLRNCAARAPSATR